MHDANDTPDQHNNSPLPYEELIELRDLLAKWDSDDWWQMSDAELNRMDTLYYKFEDWQYSQGLWDRDTYTLIEEMIEQNTSGGGDTIDGGESGSSTADFPLSLEEMQELQAIMFEDYFGDYWGITDE